jgi:hypothetical protein
MLDWPIQWEWQLIEGRPLSNKSFALRSLARHQAAIICGLGTVAALGLAAYGILLATSLWRVLPFWDQWDAVATYQAWTTGAQSFPDVFRPHNEHRLPLTQLGFLVDFAFFQGRAIFAHWLLLLVHVALGAAIGLVATRGLAAGARTLAVTAGIAFLVAPVQIDNLVWPFHLQWAASGLLALGAFFLTARLAEPMPPAARATTVVSAAAFTTLTVYSSANGLAAAPMVAVMALVLPIGRAARIVLVATAALSVASFFVGYTLPAGDPGFRVSLDSLQGVLQFLAYVRAFLGSIGQFSYRILPVLGIVGLAIWAAAALALVWRLRNGASFDPSTCALLMLAALAIATAAMSALGRAGMSPQQALSARYATWSILFWASLAGALWRLADAAGRPRLKVATLGITAWLLVLSYLSGRYFVDYARSNAATIDMVTVELRAGRILPEHLLRVHPGGEAIRPQVEFLRAHRLSVFAD